MQKIQLLELSIEEFQDIIKEAVEEKFNEAIEKFNKKEEVEFITRKETAKLLSISLPTLNFWSKRNIVISYRIGTRVLYKKHEIEKALKKIYSD